MLLQSLECLIQRVTPVVSDRTRVSGGVGSMQLRFNTRECLGFLVHAATSSRFAAGANMTYTIYLRLGYRRVCWCAVASETVYDRCGQNKCRIPVVLTTFPSLGDDVRCGG